MSYEENTVKTLVYAPSVSVYVACRTASGYEYIDVSADVTTCQVGRVFDNCSTFSFSLLNHQGKYNGKISPMDLCTIYAQKEGKTTRLITGYITTATAYSLYPGEFSVSGQCALYRLTKLYWDPGLVASWDAFGMEQSSRASEWQGYEKLLLDLLVKVGKVPESDISIGPLPAPVLSLMNDMWTVKQEDIKLSEQYMIDFYELLATTGMTGSAGGGTEESGTTSGGGGGDGNLIVEKAKEKLGCTYVWGACHSMSEIKNPDQRTFDCSGLSAWAYYQAGVHGFGYDGIFGSNTIGQANTLDQVDISSRDNLKAGDMVFFGSKGNSHHVGIYCGDGTFIHAPRTGDVVKITKLSSRSDLCEAGRATKWLETQQSSSSSGNDNASVEKTIKVPDGLGKVASYEKGNISWAAGTKQRKFWSKKSKLSVDSNGFYKWENNRYVIAMRPKFGLTGQRVNVHLSNGKVLYAVLGDEKGEDAGNEWGHLGGSCIVEFIVKSDVKPQGCSSTWYGSVSTAQQWLTKWWNKNFRGDDSNVCVTKVEKCGKVI